VIVRIRILILYAVLVIGGVIHILGRYATTMLQIAGWMLIALAIWLAVEFICCMKSKPESRTGDRDEQPHFLVWSLTVVVLTWSLEWLGVHTGVIFGDYQYHPVLRPQFAGVPLAIGFSWLTLLLSAAALERRLPFRPHADAAFIRSLRIAVLLLVFDLVMEPGAVNLGYWRWQGGVVPWKNYLTWFGIGWALAFVTLRLDLWRRSFPKIAPHFYLAQMVYFSLVILAA
jgi:uncharacterized membrane protein